MLGSAGRAFRAGQVARVRQCVLICMRLDSGCQWPSSLPKPSACAWCLALHIQVPEHTGSILHGSHPALRLSSVQALRVLPPVLPSAQLTRYTAPAVCCACSMQTCAACYLQLVGLA